MLEALTEVDLSKNQIRALPDSIGDCVNLRRLNLSVSNKRKKEKASERERKRERRGRRGRERERGWMGHIPGHVPGHIPGKFQLPLQFSGKVPSKEMLPRLPALTACHTLLRPALGRTLNVAAVTTSDAVSTGKLFGNIALHLRQLKKLGESRALAQQGGRAAVDCAAIAKGVPC